MYFAALTIAAGAIVSQLVSKQHAGLGMASMAHSAQAVHDGKVFANRGQDALASVEAHESVRLKEVAYRYARWADLWGGVGFVLAVLAGVYWVSARLHHGVCGQRLLLAVLAGYLLLLVIVV
jgi:hypothetical protein